MTDQNAAENVATEGTENVDTDVDTDVAANGDLDIENLENLEEALAANDIGSETEGDLTPEATDTTDTTDDTDAGEAPEAPVRKDFADRATDMGLVTLSPGCFHYVDTRSEVAYMNLVTMGGEHNPIADTLIPHIAIFTKSIAADSVWKYVGPISNFYKFEGNGALIDRIKESLSDVGSPVFSEENYLSANLATMRHEIIISNAQNVAQVGDVFPMISVRNSYDGTKAADITFGMYFSSGDDGDVRFGSKNKLGYIRQIHIEGANTILSSAMGEYVTVFTQNIGDMITANIQSPVTEDDMMKLLDLIEKKAGKKRREDISVIITEAFGEEGQRANITSWGLFNALAKFTTLEKNINAKTILEDVVERVLVIPEQMINALAAING